MTIYEVEPRFKIANAIAFGCKLGSEVEEFPSSVDGFIAKHLVGYHISTTGAYRLYEDHI